MYLEHFGLSRPPFKITPDTSLFFEGSERGAALEALMYAIHSGEGIIKVVGEVGSGKTMLCRMLEVRLNSRIDVIYIANPSLSPENILHVIAHELNLTVLDTKGETNKVAIMQQIQTHLLKKHADNRQVVLFVEEAQSMPIATLEEIRLLSNLETDESKLLQMVLFGQPELDEKLSQPHIRQLKERITHSFNLSPFAPEDTLQYLNFRLRAVGYTGPDVFTKKTAALVKKYSAGLTRRINIIADKSLMAAYAEGSHTVTRLHITSAAWDSDYKKTADKKNRGFILGGLALLFAALATGYYIGVNNPENQPLLSDAVDDEQHASMDEPHQVKTDDIVLPSRVEPRSASQLPPRKSQELVDSTSLEQVAAVSTTSDVLLPAIASPGLPAKSEARFSSIEPPGIQARLEQTKQWLDEVAGSHYSIQLFMARSSRAAQVEDFLLNSPEGLDLTKIYIYETVVNGEVWYGVLYNDFATQNKAADALHALPSSLKVSKPFLRRISAIKRDLTKSP